MSVTATNYARVGFTTTLSPPLSGIYYVSIAVYNAPTQAFTVQNGVSQNTLSGQSAQLFSMPSNGSPLALQPFPNNYPYGAYLGPLQAVWFEPSDSSGSYPVTLGALAGLVQWTPVVTLDAADPIYVVPGAPINSIVISDASDTSETITITGAQSATVVGTGILGGNSSVTIPLDAGTGDSVFSITSSAPITAIVSLVVGVAPLVTKGAP